MMATTVHTLASSKPEPVFNRDRHIKYHLRCLKTLLPTQYTTNDASRMALAFFTLNALDHLSALESTLTASERHNYIDWIYHCQLEGGGFRGFTGTIIGQRQHPPAEACWDVANLAGTFFALELLVLLGDNLKRVKRRNTLRWLHKLQWEDGSFGELIGPAGERVDGQDIRFCYMAAAIRHILQFEPEVNVPEVVDIDVDALVNFVQISQAYDGGFGRRPMQESNAGWTYCAIACLKLLSRLPEEGNEVFHRPRDEPFPISVDRLLHWLVSRQVPCPTVPDSDEEVLDRVQDPHSLQALHVDNSMRPTQIHAENTSVPLSSEEEHCAGFNGRCNKLTDTCYSFWVVATLEMLGKTCFIDQRANRRYLLERTEHRIGGFGKSEGDPPGMLEMDGIEVTLLIGLDIMHSSLGIVALAFLQEPDVKPTNPALCLSSDISQRIKILRKSWET